VSVRTVVPLAALGIAPPRDAAGRRLQRGLALTITGIGLVAVLARGAFRRVSLDGRIVALLPTASALVIVAAGLVMTLHALPEVG
jgi:ABC-type nickel/cobalt efflux system permease component RcnA